MPASASATASASASASETFDCDPKSKGDAGMMSSHDASPSPSPSGGRGGPCLGGSRGSPRSSSIRQRSILKQTSSTLTGGRGRDRSVSFSSVSISEHSLTLGDHPDVSHGPPITLSWTVERTSTRSLDDFETDRGPGGSNPRKTIAKKSNLAIKKIERNRILLDAGHTWDEIDAATDKSNRDKARREIVAAGLENPLIVAVEDKVRSLVRKCSERSRVVLMKSKSRRSSGGRNVGVGVGSYDGGGSGSVSVQMFALHTKT